MLKLSTVRKWITVLMLIYFAFYPHISIINGSLLYVVLVAAMGLSLICISFSYKKNNYVGNYQLAWIIILFMSLIRNWGISRRVFLWPAAFVALILMFLALSNSTQWHKTFYKIATIISSIYIIGMVYFLINPSAFSMMRTFWNYWPNGTEYGVFGYRAGLADNHSANGTYCVVAFLICSSLWITGAGDRKERRRYATMTLVAGLAVFLTTKRAHLVFGLAALLLVYYVFSKKRMSSKLFKLLGIAAVVLVLFYTIPYTSLLNDYTSGFFDYIGTDVTNGRIEYWLYALALFASNPLFGIGWLGFRYNSGALLYTSTHEGFAQVGYVDAHNVYVQLLSETGIIGTVIVISVFIVFLRSTIALYKKHKNDLTEPQQRALAVSFCFQVFCLIYGLTGNFFYDRTCFIYMFGCALFCSVENEVRKTLREKKMNAAV